ncbi:MAG: hypothetical protein M0031_03125 [Thermaerobacter sp.]|nr:hypothetical protein [Thermaerobacter sp.]
MRLMRRWGVAVLRIGKARNMRGQAVVELAIILPLTAILFTYMVQIAFILEAQIALERGVNQAAQYAFAQQGAGTSASTVECGAAGIVTGDMYNEGYLSATQEPYSQVNATGCSHLVTASRQGSLSPPDIVLQTWVTYNATCVSGTPVEVQAYFDYRLFVPFYATTVKGVNYYQLTADRKIAGC